MKKNTFLAIIACLLWSTAFVGVKFTLNYWPPLVLAGVRFMLAGMLLLPFCGGFKNLRGELSRHRMTVVWLGLFQTVFLYAAFFIAMQYVRGAVAAIVIGASPLWAALVAHVMMPDDKMTRKHTLAILCGIGGVVIISFATKPWEPVGLQEFWGVLLLLSGSIMSAVSNVIVAKKKKKVHPVALNSLQMFFGGVVLLLMGLFWEGVPPVVCNVSFYAALLWLAALSAIAFSIWFYLLARVKISKLNVWKFLIPVFGALTSWILLPGESPDLLSLTGVALVAGGIILSER